VLPNSTNTVRVEPLLPRAALDSRRLGIGALLILPAGLFVYLAFNSGGFYPGPTAYVAVVLCFVLALRVMLAGNPFEGAGRGLALGAGAFALYALLTLISILWSHAPGRALAEFDRALVYLVALVLIGSLGRSPQRLRWMLRAFAAAIVGVCAAALITRLLPHLWPTTNAIAINRLAFPLTYWNALALIGAFGIVLCLHLSSDASEPAASRVLAAAAVPVLATTVYFTFSRGGIAAAAIGVVAYALIARPRALVSAVIATVPAGVAVAGAYHASLLATPNSTTPAAIIQGRHVAYVVLACVAVAALVRGVLVIVLDRRLERVRLPNRVRVQIRRWGWGGVVAVTLIAIVALNGTITREAQRFMKPAQPGTSSDYRARLTDPANDGRIDMWRVSWHGFLQAPILGHGAGTYENTWAQYRPNADTVVDAHSLYLQTLDELGIIGFVLLVGVIVGLLGRTASFIRGPDRPLYAAAFTVMLVWAIHAGIDWDWEMPAVTLPFFALGGAILSTPHEHAAGPIQLRTRVHRLNPSMRIALCIGCCVVAAVPAQMWRSQRSLDEATAAFARDDCGAATRSALSSISILGDRPEPYEVMGYCDVRRGRPALGVAATEKAISLDPDNWNYWYDLAVIRASAGLDPISAIHRAITLDPREPLVRQALHAFRAGGRDRLERDGRTIAAALVTL
jgi:hypothetical protein